ncbi:MAG: hypothetical protein ACYS6K_00840 [Planctomycetota bacterium]
MPRLKRPSSTSMRPSDVVIRSRPGSDSFVDASIRFSVSRQRELPMGWSETDTLLSVPWFASSDWSERVYEDNVFSCARSDSFCRPIITTDKSTANRPPIAARLEHEQLYSDVVFIFNPKISIMCSLLDVFSYGNDLVLSALGCFDGIPL